MKDNIVKILQETPWLKGREIAHRLNADKKEVNAFLHSHSDLFIQDNEFRWALANQFRVEFAKNTWINSASFEQSLARCGSPLDDDCSSVVFVLPEGCKVLLEAAARLMALCNQLAWKGKQVVLDFTDSGSTRSYFNRIGFFDHLAPAVTVIPARPTVSGAEIFRGNADTLMEFGAIDPVAPDESIPVQLKHSFVNHAGEEYSQPAFTVLAELFDNVRDHAESPLPGFAALQCYKATKAPHIQTVISDSGKGIVETLRPILQTRYPDVASKIAEAGDAADAHLVREIFERGQITQCEPGRGLGLKASGDVAAKFKAKISIRQETFEVILQYTGAKRPKFTHSLNLPRILGTHICFDFLLDQRA